MSSFRLSKLLTITLLGIFLQYMSYAQNIAKLRFDDDFSSLKADSLKSTWKEKIKNVSLGSKFQLSLGGESREQYQSYEHLNFGEVPSDFVTDSPHQLMHRIMVHANLTYKKSFRVFAQLNNTARFFNPNPINSQIDENLLSTHQIFVDYKFKNHWIFRVGQQELAYGSERFVASREGPNTRLTFQGATLKYVSLRNKLDIFTSKPMKMNTGIFDDVTASESLYGIYFMHSSSKSRFNVDLFYFNSETNLRQYMLKKGNENRHTFGTRLYSSLGPWNYDVELAKQVGAFDELSISSYMAV